MFNIKLELSGERFSVVYSLEGDESTARAQAEDICVEQTIEFPADLVTSGDIREHLFGRIESFEPSANIAGRWETTISYAVETTGFELTQLLNVVFGNFSLKPRVRVERLELSPSIYKHFQGPRFGIPGLRQLLGVPHRPLFCTALKPMGLGSTTLAELAYRFALGGVDMIKDDHGLADQPFAPFRERVRQCAQAVERANRETGGKCLFFPNISSDIRGIMEKAHFAKDNGAGGLMAAPGLIGLDTMRLLAEDKGIGLPILSHPAFQGTFTAHRESGISPYTLFGQFSRLGGADAVIFPNYGGRFTFTKADCSSIARGAVEKMGHFQPIFTMPGGGMNLERIPGMIETYGKDVIFLIGGALHKTGPDLVENCRKYMELLERYND